MMRAGPVLWPSNAPKNKNGMPVSVVVWLKLKSQVGMSSVPVKLSPAVGSLLKFSRALIVAVWPPSLIITVRSKSVRGLPPRTGVSVNVPSSIVVSPSCTASMTSSTSSTSANIANRCPMTQACTSWNSDSLRKAFDCSSSSISPLTSLLVKVTRLDRAEKISVVSRLLLPTSTSSPTDPVTAR